MDTTRLTDTITPAQVLLSGREVRDTPYGVQEVRGGRNEQVTGLFKDRTGYWAAYMLSLIIERRITKRRLFHDSSLKVMATHFPRSLSDFRKIGGVGESKLEKYGELFVKEIDKFVDIDRQEHIIRAMSILGIERLAPIKEKLGDDYSYEEIRLVRASKMSNRKIS